MTGYASIMAITAWCASCRAEQSFEHPECSDEHGRDCPEWACVECGEAIMVGFELADPHAGRVSRPGRAARGSRPGRTGRARRRQVHSSGAA
jgi:hypothetical protein